MILNSIKKFNNYFTVDKGILFLLISISILIFIIYPFSGNSAFGSVITNLFVVTTLFSGIMSIDINRNFRRFLIFFLIFVIFSSFIGEIYEHNFITHLHIISRILFLWILIILIFIRVFSDKPMTFIYKMAGSITIYLLIGFIWANMFFIFYHIRPESFHFAVSINPEDNLMCSFLFYSFENLTTLGYGDIIPITPFLKSLVSLEAVLGPLYLAILIGRLVSGRTSIPNK